MALLMAVAVPPVVATAGQGAEDPADRAMKRWDRDGDGRLTREELPERVRRNFDRVDRDGDGFIGPEVGKRVRLFLEKVLLGADVTVSAEPIENTP